MLLEDFDIEKVSYDLEDLKKTNDENVFISLSVELFKELAQYITIISGINKTDENNEIRLWNRNEAILGGLMVRIIKLMDGFLDSFCNNKILINEIISRSLVETAINLLYLLKKDSDKLYDEFINYSLRNEKQLLNLIEENIEDKNYEEEIETRMKKSIKKSFNKSGVAYEDINANDYSRWGGSIYNKFKELNLDDLYLAIMGLKSHAVHGNWQDLLSNHLLYENGKFKPNYNRSISRPQTILGVGYLVGIITIEYVDDFLPNCEDKKHLRNLIDELVDKIIEVDELHESYLNRSR